MIFISFLLAILTEEKEISITDSFIGDWEVTHVTLNQNGEYAESPDIYKLNVMASGDDFIGNLTGVKSTEIQQIDIKIVKKSDLVYSLLFSTGGSEEFKELTSPLTFTTGVDYLIQTFGQINSKETFSFHFLSIDEVEITLYNPEDNSVSFYRLIKSLPPQKPPISGLHLLLPLIPVFVMMYNRDKERRLEIQRRNRQINQNRNKKD